MMIGHGTHSRRHADEVVAVAAAEFRQSAAESTAAVPQPALHRLEQLHRLSFVALFPARPCVPREKRNHNAEDTGIQLACWVCPLICRLKHSKWCFFAPWDLSLPVCPERSRKHKQVRAPPKTCALRVALFVPPPLLLTLTSWSRPPWRNRPASEPSVRTESTRSRLALHTCTHNTCREHRGVENTHGRKGDVETAMNYTGGEQALVH